MDGSNKTGKEQGDVIVLLLHYLGNNCSWNLRMMR